MMTSRGYLVNLTPTLIAKPPLTPNGYIGQIGFERRVGFGAECDHKALPLGAVGFNTTPITQQTIDRVMGNLVYDRIM